MKIPRITLLEPKDDLNISTLIRTIIVELETGFQLNVMLKKVKFIGFIV